MDSLKNKIDLLKKKKNAVILAHTYQPGEVQDVADYTGDSYGLSVEASRTEADIIVFAGVRFMAETAAILSPQKTVLLPQPDASCPMADMITPEELAEIKTRYPSYKVMCYVNSTAEIKALSDICCTSSNALTIAKKLPSGTGIIFVPDKHLGSYVQEKTGLSMVLWDGFCPTHLQMNPSMIEKAKKLHPEAVVLMHPEAAHKCRALSDQILSTGGMCDYVKQDHKNNEYIIATETGIIHTLKKQNPEKSFFHVSDEVICPNMKKGSLESIINALEGNGGEVVKVDAAIASKALASLKKMLEMS